MGVVAGVGTEAEVVVAEVEVEGPDKVAFERRAQACGRTGIVELNALQPEVEVVGVDAEGLRAWPDPDPEVGAPETLSRCACA